MTGQDPYDAFVLRFEKPLVETAGGPLSGRTFAAKDLFDVKGYPTGAGNPDWAVDHPEAASHSWAVARLLEAGAGLVGKTHTDELSRGLFGENSHYGTPVNPRWPAHVPGGSSSGSAAAVAAGLVDMALGTDTGGSVRIPACFCGIYGIRTTHGRVPFTGGVHQAPSFDTVGWFARDTRTLLEASRVLLRTSDLSRLPKRLLIAEDLFAMADPAVQDALQAALRKLGQHGAAAARPILPETAESWPRHQGALQGREAWDTFADWLDQRNPRLG